MPPECGRPYVEILNNALIAVDLDQVACAEGVSPTEQNAGEKILSDVAEGETGNDA